jgi:hypothetical protein
MIRRRKVHGRQSQVPNGFSFIFWWEVALVIVRREVVDCSCHLDGSEKGVKNHPFHVLSRPARLLGTVVRMSQKLPVIVAAALLSARHPPGIEWKTQVTATGRATNSFFLQLCVANRPLLVFSLKQNNCKLQYCALLDTIISRHRSVHSPLGWTLCTTHWSNSTFLLFLKLCLFTRLWLKCATTIIVR